jgi:hypothetical protein
MNFSQIYEGWRNNLFPPSHIKELIRETAERRINICLACPHHSKNHKTPLRPDDHCTHCGCTLAAKTKCLSCSCPLDRWMALMTEDEEENVKNILDGKEKRTTS